MPSTQQFRKRIKAVKNTSQITRAMEMVASVKMQKATKTILNARRYIQNSWNTLEMLARITSPDKHPLLQQRPNGKTAVIVITSDRGLCGSYNTNILNKALNLIRSESNAAGADKQQLDLIAVGQKGANLLKRISGTSFAAEFTDFGREIQFEESTPIAKMVINDYINGQYNRILVVYSHFESSLKQTPVIKQLLPITSEHIDIPQLWEQASADADKIEYKFEPSPDAVLNSILTRFIHLQLFGALLEANASEHAARMVAMKNATDNARDLIDELTLTYNSIRQDSITREIAEISGAADAMK
ncbi:MAG: ATP synthase gamma chain [bacterium ADurb.Bin400]|nr:MAG: ATP synthase gamma chain [bacterium ADurb.Bin400]